MKLATARAKDGVRPDSGQAPDSETEMQTALAGKQRIDWVDYAKGFCIVMVVMMHSTFGVELAAGQQSWMHAISDFAKPFRMPDFFLISGLFLARAIDRDWTTYLDRRVWHFVYFYVLWLTIQIGFKAPGLAAETGALGVVQLYLHSLHRPVRHALVHLSAAGLLRGDQARAPRAAASRLAGRHRARDRSASTPATRWWTSSPPASSTSTPATGSARISSRLHAWSSNTRSARSRRCWSGLRSTA